MSLTNGWRRQRQRELVFQAEPAGEARSVRAGRAEPDVAERATKSPAITTSLMEEICHHENLKQALKRVVQNRGAPGADGMNVRNLGRYLAKHWPTHRDQLLRGTYKPMPVRRVEIPKPGGGVRKLGIPTVLDRFVQQAVMQVLQARWEPMFSEHSYGFRPGRSQHQAVAAARQYVRDGCSYVVDIDLEKFFDRVNHDILMSRIARQISDKAVLKLVRAFLTAGVLESGLTKPTAEGTPQGGPLSPLLSNIMLHDLDCEIERRNLRFVRYADDCGIYVRSLRAGERVMRGLCTFITRRLKLKVNDQKSAVARPWERKFLGFRILRGPRAKLGIAPQSLVRMKRRVRELTRPTRGSSLKKVVSRLARYLIGWRGYYGHCETPSILSKLDSWIRRRLRCAVWRAWKTRRKRYKELRRRGVREELARHTAGARRDRQRLSSSEALHRALPNAFFLRVGLPCLFRR